MQAASHRRMTAAAALALPALMVAMQAASAAAQGAFSVGMNLDGVSDYTAQSPFVDAMRQARHFGSPGSPWDEAAAVDAQGWPTQDAGAVILCCVGDAANHSLIAGTYGLSFTGQATLSLVAAAGAIAGQSYDAATNITTAQVTLQDNGAGTLLALAFTNTKRLPGDNPGTGVTGVHLIRPQHAPNGAFWWRQATQDFTSPFLDLLKPFAVLRAMGFTNTNGSPAINWQDRTTTSSATQQSPSGVAWDYVLTLANTLQKDVWINVPDQATDAYVASLAALVTRRLNPALHIYLEYSNEVWNYSFPQAARNQAAAEAEVAADMASPLAWNCTDYATCRYVWGARRVGERTVQIARIFQTALGARAAMLRPVYATQVGQTYYLSLVLPMIETFFGQPSTLLYGIAQAPYWTGDTGLDGLTAAQELKNAAANLKLQAAPEAAFTTWARYYGLQSITYEGGPGMSGTASLDAKIAANRAPAMGRQVDSAISGAAGNGLSLYTYFNDAGAYGQYGMWGATENVFDLQTPKLRALRQQIALGTAPLTAGHAVPGDFTPVEPDIGFGSGFIDSTRTYAYLRNGGIFGYLVNIPSDGAYTVAIKAGNYYAETTATVTLDRIPSATLTIPATGGDDLNFTLTNRAPVQLAAGLHVLAIEATAGEFSFDSVSLQQAVK